MNYTKILVKNVLRSRSGNGGRRDFFVLIYADFGNSVADIETRGLLQNDKVFIKNHNFKTFFFEFIFIEFIKIDFILFWPNKFGFFFMFTCDFLKAYWEQNGGH